VAESVSEECRRVGHAALRGPARVDLHELSAAIKPSVRCLDAPHSPTAYPEPAMTITAHVDAHDHIHNFERAFLGPGVYVLYDGSAADKNIVYIGKSTSDMLMRVSTHRQTKDFDRVAVILPATTHEVHIHNLEHFVIAEFVDRFGRLPEFNRQRPRFQHDGRSFNWHQMGRRVVSSIFVGDERPRSLAGRGLDNVVTVGGVAAMQAHLERAHPTATRDWLWQKTAKLLGGAYSPATLRQYCGASGLHGNTILDRLVDSH